VRVSPEPEAAGASRAQRAGTGVVAAALLLAGSQLASRVLGYLRDVVLARLEGSSPQADAYFAAFLIPDILNHLLAGGALSIAFIPFYTRALARGGEQEAERLLSVVLGTLSAVAVAATAALWWGTDLLVARLYPAFPPEVRALTAELTRIVLPAQIFFIVGGVINGVLLARRSFRAAALAPLIYNVCIIAGGWLLHASIGVRGFAWGVLAGAFLGPLLVPLLNALPSVRIRMRVAPRDPLFVRYLLVAAPLMIGQSLLTVDEWFDRYFGARLGEGALSSISYARKLMLVPVAIVGQAIGTAALPALAQLYEQSRIEELNRAVLRTLQAGLALGALLAPALALLAPAAVALVYLGGRFGPDDVIQVSELLAILCLGVPGWVVQQIAVRPFYARGDTLRPMLLGTAIVLAAFPIYWALSATRGIEGLALAGAIAMSVNAAATVLVARHLHGAPELGPLLAAGARAAGIALLASGAAALAIALAFGPEALSRTYVPTGAEALLMLAVGGAAYGAVALAAALLATSDRDCDRPLPPAVPDGKTASNVEMIGAKQRAKLYLDSVETYLDCLKQAEESVTETGRDVKMKRIEKKRTEMETERTETVTKFNEQVRVYKIRTGEITEDAAKPATPPTSAAPPATAPAPGATPAPETKPR
jgi:putative peptidoglycan lipid II flippase